MFSTPSPVRAFSHALPGSSSRFPDTPVTAAMAATSWLRNMAASTSLQVVLPMLLSPMFAAFSTMAASAWWSVPAVRQCRMLPSTPLWHKPSDCLIRVLNCTVLVQPMGGVGALMAACGS